MKATISRFSHLAPLHIPAGLEAIEATEAALPGVYQIGVFDTAFFADIPPYAYLYPVPYQWYEDWGIRRFGFHGTSHAYCTDRAIEMLGRDKVGLRLVVCHLGQGSSATAVRDGIAVTNTMGFTPLEGFMMGTRSGTVDPGILIYVQREKGLSVDQLDDILHHKSGLLGISGLSSDFRQVEAAAREGHRRAQLALDIYAYRVRTMVGALVVTLGGLGRTGLYRRDRREFFLVAEESLRRTGVRGRLSGRRPQRDRPAGRRRGHGRFGGSRAAHPHARGPDDRPGSAADGPRKKG